MWNLLEAGEGALSGDLVSRSRRLQEPLLAPGGEDGEPSLLGNAVVGVSLARGLHASVHTVTSDLSGPWCWRPRGALCRAGGLRSDSVSVSPMRCDSTTHDGLETPRLCAPVSVGRGSRLSSAGSHEAPVSSPDATFRGATSQTDGAAPGGQVLAGWVAQGPVPHWLEAALVALPRAWLTDSSEHLPASRRGGRPPARAASTLYH